MKKILFAVALVLVFSAFEAKALDLVGMAQKAQDKVDAAEKKAKQEEAKAKLKQDLGQVKDDVNALKGAFVN